MKGKILIIKLGTYILVKINGVIIPTFKFLKNSTSSQDLKLSKAVYYRYND